MSDLSWAAIASAIAIVIALVMSSLAVMQENWFMLALGAVWAVTSCAIALLSLRE